MKEIIDCEVCGSKNLYTILDLGKHPLCDDLIPIGSELISELYPIEILFCNKCLTCHHRFQVPKKKLFTEQYHYRARMTKSVLNGMEDFVSSCENIFGNLNGISVLDIGCNDGSLLNIFRLKGCKTYGVEPTKAAFDSNHFVINNFFDADSVNIILKECGEPDLITFTNVFAHIEDLRGVLLNLKKIIGPQTKVVIENHYLGSVLDFSQFDTFYHEHPRTYSLTSFSYIAKSLGLNLVNFEFVSRYGGNIRAFLSHGKAIDFLPINENRFSKMFGPLNIEILNWKRKTRKKLLEINKEYGPIPAKAFPGRAAILIRLLNLTENNISAVYEIKGSIKVGHYVPYSKIPILPESELYSLPTPPHIILNLAWHLPIEVRKNLSSNNYQGNVIDIKEFKILND